MPRSFQFIEGTHRAKKNVCLDRETGGLPPDLTSLAFHKEKSVPKRDARNLVHIGRALLDGIALAVRSEGRRAGLEIGTSAPLADSGQAIWGATCRCVGQIQIVVFSEDI